MDIDRNTLWFYCSIFAGLCLFSVLGGLLRRRHGQSAREDVIGLLNRRIRLWWTMLTVFAIASATGGTGSIIVFATTSFLLLREFITMAPTRRGDHHTLFWVFFVILPLQYVLLGFNWYGLFIIFIPVYAFLFVPVRSVLAGDPARFQERVARIQWSLMLAVYCVSHAPALLQLPLPGSRAQAVRLLLLLVVLVQLNDVVRMVVDHLSGCRKLVPEVSSTITGLGIAVGAASAMLASMLLAHATPFSMLQSIGIAAAVALMGSSGALCLAAVKRDRGRAGVTVIDGRGSTADGVVPLCFAAPVFFHIVRFYFTGAGPMGF